MSNGQMLSLSAQLPAQAESQEPNQSHLDPRYGAQSISAGTFQPTRS